MQREMTFLPQVGVDSRSARATPTIAPFQIRGRLITAIVLQMTGDVDDAFYAALDAKLKQAAHFFTFVPLVLDLEKAAGCVIDFRLLVLEMRTRKLTLAGIQNPTAEQKRAALAAGLITLRNGRDVPLDEGKQTAATTKADDSSHSGTLIVTDPVRSGQRIFAENGDLVVIGSVGSGAEIMARGNIHVYGRMRGRALAGAKGDATARIFCQSLEAELIAIAGIYRTSDDIEASVRKQRIQVFLKDDALSIEALK
jgi:septum site-determining protein MinC